jgi:hypothetical protein
VLPRDSRIYYERDYRERFEGMASLRIEFGGESNPDYTGPHQMLILPAGRLRLEFTARSEGITSDQGISVELVVLADRRRLAGAGPILGTTDWTRYSASFEVDQPRAAMVMLRRRPSEKFDNSLGGRLWIDEVRIRPEKE